MRRVHCAHCTFFLWRGGFSCLSSHIQFISATLVVRGDSAIRNPELIHFRLYVQGMNVHCTLHMVLAMLELRESTKGEIDEYTIRVGK